MKIDLYQYIGQEVICELEDGSYLKGVVGTHTNSVYFPFSIDQSYFNQKGEGYSKPNIVNIQLMFTGIAQKAPNINLSEFGDQRVYVKLNNGSAYVQRFEKQISNYWTIANIASFDVNGICTINKNYNINEIYGEGAYEIKTKPTFDEPEDKQIEEAKQLLSKMSEEQVAKLLKSLK